MRSWKRLLTIVLCVCATMMVISSPALAVEMGVEEEQCITYYADGSYSVTKIIYDELEDEVSAQSGAKETSATKQRDYYNNSDKLVWTLYVHGTFTYDGRTAKATDADYSYQIYNSDWSFVSGSASYSGATAKATGKFSWHSVTSSATVSLTCSADGVLS